MAAQKPGRTAAELADAVDLIRFSEDQFVWLGRAARRRRRPDALHALRLRTVRLPGSGRQQHVRGGRTPCWSLFEADGDRLAFAKAKALADNLTVVQNALDG